MMSGKMMIHFIPDLVRMLDNVLLILLTTLQMSFRKLVIVQMRERSIGLGAMGFHAYLQRHNIPFESAMAKGRNMAMFWHIKSEAETATRQLAGARRMP